MSETTTKLLTTAIVLLAVAAAAQTAPDATMTLRRAAELALERSPDVAAAQASAHELAATARLAADEFRPQAWLTATPGYGHGLPTAIAGSVPSFAGLSWRTTLYDRAARAEILGGQAASCLANAGSDRARVEAVKAVLLAYSNCWADERILPALHHRQEAAQSMLDHAASRQAAGRATELDVEQARLDVARARLRTLDRETASDLDRLELSRLTGWPTAAMAHGLHDPLASLPDVRPGDDLGMARAADPELRAGARAVDLLSKAAEMAAATTSPVVQAEAQYARLSRANHYDTYYRNFVEDTWSVGVSVMLPLWTGGRRGDGAAHAAASLARAQAEHASRAAALEAEVRRALLTVDRARAAASIAHEAAAVAREALRVSLARADQGRADVDEVERRQIALADAEEDEVRAEASSFAARVDLLALRGDLLDDIVGSPAPSRHDEDPPVVGSAVDVR